MIKVFLKLLGILGTIAGPLKSAFDLAQALRANRIQAKGRWAAQDRRLFDELRNLLDENTTMRELRAQDYRGAFSRLPLQHLDQFLDRSSHADCKFFDAKVEKRRKLLHDEIERFRNLLMQETFALDDRPDYSRVPDLRKRESVDFLRKVSNDDEDFERRYAELSQHLERVCNQLNEMADRIIELHREFIRAGRERLAQ